MYHTKITNFGKHQGKKTTKKTQIPFWIKGVLFSCFLMALTERVGCNQGCHTLPELDPTKRHLAAFVFPRCAKLNLFRISRDVTHLFLASGFLLLLKIPEEASQFSLFYIFLSNTFSLLMTIQSFVFKEIYLMHFDLISDGLWAWLSSRGWQP